MKLTDIDLSSLADVAGALTLLESVHQRLATGGVPLPSLAPAEFVVNPAPTADPEKLWGLGTKAMDAALAADAENLRGLGVDPITAQPICNLRPDPAGQIAQDIDAMSGGTLGAGVFRPDTLDAAAVFGGTSPRAQALATQQGAPAQSAAPLPLVPSTAGVAPSATAPVALTASGALPALQALAPLPVASAAAPAAPAPQASPAGGVELDADGLPWDDRIHAGTKRKNADGRWTAKRGINDPDLVPRVQAQLRAQMAAGGVTAPAPVRAGVPNLTVAHLHGGAPAQSAAPLPASTPAPSTAPLAALPMTNGPVSSAAPTPPALPDLQPPAAPQQSSGAKPVPLTFQDFMTAMTVEVMSGRVPATALLEACKPYGGTTALAANPAPIPEIWAALKAQYPGML